MEYDTNLNRLNGTFYASDDPQCMDLEADIYMDNCLVEAFIDGERLQIKNLEVYEAGGNMGGGIYR